MKKKALATRMAAFVMAGAMTLGMGFTALAAESDMQKLENAVHKTVNTDANTFVPTTTFKFTVAPTTRNEYGNTSIDQNGIDGGLVFKNGNDYSSTGEIPFTSATDINHIGENHENTTDLYIDKSKFTAAGKYHYIISEVIPTDTGNDKKYQGMDYDANTKEVIVYAYYPEGSSTLTFQLAVKESEQDETGKEIGKTTIAFNNTYGTGDENSKVKNLKIEKKLEGNLASDTDNFTVTIKITRDATSTETEYYKYVYTDANDATGSKEGVISSGIEGITLPIQGKDTIMIYGLTAEDVVNVYEVTDENDNTKTNNGYTPRYELSENSKEKDLGSATGDIATGYNVTIATANGKADVAELIITNSKNATTPTGIVTEYAPYILLVAAAGAFAVLFLRRKKEEF